MTDPSSAAPIMEEYTPTKAQCGRFDWTTSLFWGRGNAGMQYGIMRARDNWSEGFSHDAEELGTAKHALLDPW